MGSAHPYKILALLHQQAGLLFLYKSCELWFHKKKTWNINKNKGAFIKITICTDLMFLMVRQLKSVVQ